MSRDYKMEQRRAELEAALAAVGMVVPENSGICDGYVSDSLPPYMTLSHVVNKLCVMNYLFNHTRYTEVLSGLYKDQPHMQKRDMLATAKNTALRERPIPKMWPWLKCAAHSAAGADGWSVVS